MDETTVGFEQIINATLRMLRTSWKASSAVFLQTDDDGSLRMRASDGKVNTSPTPLSRKGNLATCVEENKVIEVSMDGFMDGLAAVIPEEGKGKKLVLVPVLGQARVLGVLVLGPFEKATDINSREAELRSAGALCAVLSAHWRLYEWMSQYLIQANHELRTPLTAIQGSLGMVLGGVCGQVGGEVKEMLEMAQKGCERTVRAIEGYLTKQEFENHDK